jgi:hypothetical protein
MPCPPGSGRGTPSQYYVDFSGGNDTTGDGTVGTPWKTIEKALDTITRDATNGDQINVKDDADETITTTFSLATYGTPTGSAPLIFRGYTTAANDGGIGGVDMQGNNNTMITAAVLGVSWIDMHLHNTGSATVLDTGELGAVINCEINNSTGSGLVLGNEGGAYNNYIHNIGANGISVARTGIVYCNYLANGTNDFTDAITTANTGCTIERNIISIDGSTNGITTGSFDDPVRIINNSILCASGTGKGIAPSANGLQGAMIVNNLVEGFSGAGGVGYDMSSTTENMDLYQNNGARNNTTNYSGDGDVFPGITDNEALGATPFDKSGSDTFANRFTYFAPADTGNVRGGAYPGTGFTRLDKGAVQHADPAAGTTTIITRPKRII